MMRRPGPLLSTLLAALTVVLSGGCSSLTAAEADTVTRGLYLEMYAWGAENYAVFYRVGTDGSLGFGGGMDAQIQNVSWTGALTAEEIDQLWVLMEEHGWFTGAVKAATHGDRKQMQYRIRVRWPHGGRKYRIKGPNPDVAPVEHLLARAARRRMDSFLKTMPRPSEDSGTNGGAG